jgi:hypothetical protein
MDEVGHGGMPDLKHKYVKLYTGEYVIEDSIIAALRKGVEYPVVIDACYAFTQRIGNLKGTFGISETHGQAPGYRIYKLWSEVPLKVIGTGTGTDESKEDVRNQLIAIMVAIRDGDQDVAKAEIEKYRETATEIEQQSLPLKILFVIANICSEAGGEDSNDFYEELSSFEDVLETLSFNEDTYDDMIETVWNIERRKQYIELEDSYANIPKKNAKGMRRQDVIIEALVRSDMNITNEEVLMMAFPEFNVSPPKKLSPRIYAAILARAVVVDNYELLKQIKDLLENSTQPWGLEKDHPHYLEIINRVNTTPDTYEEMIAFYKKLEKTRVKDI